MRYLSNFRRAKPSSSRYLLGSLVAGVAVALAASWIWRRKAAPRTESGTQRGSDEDAPDQPQEQRADVQSVGDGAGPLVHRRYSVVVDSALSQREVFDVMSHNLAEFAPSALANFTKAIGRDASLEVGDEFDISMLGPWNGRVRVTTKTDSSFTLVTLVGHPEAGHIVFGVEPAHEPHLVAVTIESWARARDALVELTYAKLGVGKQMQTEVWVTFLHRLSATIGVTETPDVDVSTELQSHEPADEPLNEPAHGH